jgi:hypothetical protein
MTDHRNHTIRARQNWVSPTFQVPVVPPDLRILSQIDPKQSAEACLGGSLDLQILVPQRLNEEVAPLFAALHSFFAKPGIGFDPVLSDADRRSNQTRSRSQRLRRVPVGDENLHHPP